jgi:nucleoside-diphosphate-sugar epimerase
MVRSRTGDNDMRKRCLMTGVTGALGRELLRSSEHFDVTALVRQKRAELRGQIETRLPAIPPTLTNDFQVIVHAAADTRFNASREELWSTNVEGTSEILKFARRCTKLERFIYFSTTCVWGDSVGTINPVRCHQRPNFHNPYEATKWEAENLLLESELPIQIIRIPIVIGSETDGSVARNGAIHAALRWIARGLLPIIPCAAGARLDLISSEFVGRALCRVLAGTGPSDPIIHLTNGTEAPLLTDLLALLHDWIEERFPNRSERPELVDLETYQLFKKLVKNTGDALFCTIYESAESLLSTLFYPKIIQPSRDLDPQQIAWPKLCQKVFEAQISPIFAPLPKYLRAAPKFQNVNI